MVTEIFGMDSRLLFTGVVAVEGAERVLELVISRRNAARTLARGGVESGQAVNWAVIVLHLLWLAALLAEVWLLDRPFVPQLALSCGVLLVLAMLLRLWAMASLGDRWNIRVITVPGEAPVVTGPYQFLRHPNYAALYVELFALPMLHTAWLTTMLLAPLHVIAVWLKARAEDRALEGRT